MGKKKKNTIYSKLKEVTDKSLDSIKKVSTKSLDYGLESASKVFDHSKTFIVDKKQGITTDSIKKVSTKSLDYGLESASKVYDHSKTFIVDKKQGITTDSIKKVSTKSLDYGLESASKAYDHSKTFVLDKKQGITTSIMDDVEIIEKECPLFERIIKNKIPISVKQSVVFAVGASLTTLSETQLMRMTKKAMDHDGAFFQKTLESVFDKDQIKNINQWIDKVPGTDHFGGSVAHRLQHGHDIESLIEIFNDHNVEGFLTWINHVWFRDFWTPTGVPYLPKGSETIYEFLVDVGVSKSTAADLLSINSAELLAIILAWKAFKGFKKSFINFLNSKRAKKEWETGSYYEELKDYDKADFHFYNVLSIETNNPFIDMWYASQFLDRALSSNKTTSWSPNLIRAYELSSNARRLINNEHTVSYPGGIQVSLLALNANLICSSFSAKTENYEILKGPINSAIESCILASDKLMNPSMISVKKFGFVKRPFSAIANDYLALNLLLNIQFDKDSRYTPTYLRTRISNSINYIFEHGNELEQTYAQKMNNAFNRIYPITN